MPEYLWEIGTLRYDDAAADQPLFRAHKRAGVGLEEKEMLSSTGYWYACSHLYSS
jgi:hypothetical protein